METISKKKQELIDKYLSEPIKVGESVLIKGLGSQNKESWGNTAEVKEIDGTSIKYSKYGYDELSIAVEGEYKKFIKNVGINPFPINPDRINSINFELYSILFKLGLTKEKDGKYDIDGIVIKNVNFNPFIFDDKGEKVYYQRPLVWTLKDKQNLIESIYQNVDCGKILIRNRGWDELGKLVKKGETDLAWSDVVDGKQRLNAMFDFINGKFPDNNGNYYSDLSDNAQHKLLSHQLFSYSELPEGITDKEVINQFLKLNFAGVPQSIEHIEFVKNINLR